MHLPVFLVDEPMTPPGPAAPRFDLPNLGLGVGLRPVHYGYIVENQPPVDWFEIISENYLDHQGRPLYYLDQVAERYPVVMHGVSLSIGSSDPLDVEYVKKLRTLADRVKAVWVSDHLCWTGILHRNTHDLLPLPYTEKCVRHDRSHPGDGRAARAKGALIFH